MTEKPWKTKTVDEMKNWTRDINMTWSKTWRLLMIGMLVLLKFHKNIMCKIQH